MVFRQLKITYERRRANSLHGRFGGNWQWNVGVQASGGFRTIIINLLIASIRIDRTT